MDSIPSSVLCDEILSRLPFELKLKCIPLVCKTWETSLRRSRQPNLWGPITICVSKMAGKADTKVLSSMLWLGLRAAAISSLHLEVETGNDTGPSWTFLSKYLPILLGYLQHAGESPKLEIYVGGSHAFGALEAAPFVQPALLPVLAARLSSLTVISEWLAPNAEHFRAISHLLQLRTLAIRCSDESGEAEPLQQLPDELFALSYLKSLSLENFTNYPNCKKWNALLDNPVYSDVWGPVTLHYNAWKQEFGKDVKRKVELIRKSLAWLGAKAPVLQCIRINFTHTAAAADHKFFDQYLPMLLGFLSLSSQERPQLELHLFELRPLTELSIHVTKAAQQLPAERSALTALTALKLHTCELTTVPAAVSKLVTLRSLSLEENYLTGFSANIFLRLTALETLSMANQTLGEFAVSDSIGCVTALTSQSLLRLTQDAGLNAVSIYHISRAVMQMRHPGMLKQS
ncbi:hypothetical protein WJX72_007174 [[Myrmecia] bisecta]|uniref:F-box domain-containing protein n=1 Tax=[Myrmecia] bisecta TaxID=41462 RepID=A0AAW1P6D2_9CHLO